MDEQTNLSRRERQIMDIVYLRGEATATEVLADLPDAPSRTTVRTLLRILEQKGHLKHTEKGREFVYRPATTRTRAGQSAVRRVLKTFFGGSLEKAVAMHLSDPTSEVSAEELKRLSALIRDARKKGN
jgi:predicted transcriptional regulator